MPSSDSKAASRPRGLHRFVQLRGAVNIPIGGASEMTSTSSKLSLANARQAATSAQLSQGP